MNPADYPYPPDEFDSAAARSGPQGAHRAQRTAWSRWGPFVLVLVLFPVLAYGVVTWLSSWDGLPDGVLPVGTDESVAESVAPQDPATTETPAETPVEEVVPPPVEPPPPVADLSREVRVFNSTNTSGLAGGAADRIEDAGFTSVTADDWEGDNLEASVVFYPAAGDVATAQAVAAALGITTVTESAEDAGETIVVVLADDYEA